MAPCKRDGCAFFGSDATNGYCSKCHKVRLQTTTSTTSMIPAATNSNSTDQRVVNERIVPTASIDEPPRNAEPREEASSAGDQAAGSSFNEEEEAAHAATMLGMAKGDSAMRCYSCNKRLRLSDNFPCRCEQVFCSSHRHYKDHACTFDYKASGRAAIAKANPVVTGSKLKKI